MAIHFLKHFTQSDENRAKTGLVPAPGPAASAKSRFLGVLRERKIYGTSGKGYFHLREVMPQSVSFTEKPLEALDRFYCERSAYAVAFDGNRIKPGLARKVLYLSEYEIRSGAFPPEDKWLVDLVRPNHILGFDEETGESIFVAKKYDFSWQEEWRITTTRPRTYSHCKQ